MLQGFHKKLSLLTGEEKSDLAKKVSEYKATILPVLRNSATWSQEIIRIFDDGLFLASSMPSAQAFCLTAHKYKQNKKRIESLELVLENLLAALPNVSPTKNSSSAIERTVSSMESIKRAAIQEDMPKHFSDYKHLLPDDLRAEGEHIADLYMEMTDVANKLETLCNDGSSLKKDRAFYATKLCGIEDKIMNLWARIDVAYAEAVGKPVSQDYKDWLEKERKTLVNERQKKLAEMTKFEIEDIKDEEEREKAKAARVARDKKFLRKADRKDECQHQQNLAEAAKELHEWGFPITPKQVEVCQLYGFDVPLGWRQKSTEERKTKQQQERNARRREERAALRDKINLINSEIEDEVKTPYRQKGLSLFTEE